MIKKNLQSSILIFTLSLFLFSCGNRNLGTPTGIVVQAEPNARINYGHQFKLETFMTYSSGKRKEITGKKELNISIKGGQISGNRVTLDAYPSNFRKDTVYVHATYQKKDLNFEYNGIIPFNYFGDLSINFSGEAGKAGEDGRNGGTALLFRNGKDGSEGTDGETGENGHDLSVHIYKDLTSQLYYIRVMDITTSKVYYYKNKDAGYPIRFTVYGGDGGNGGDGGDGGNGKDGKKTEKKTKDCGDGGNGANGGVGGNGGTGGTVYIFVHPTADGIQDRITVMNSAGNGGKGGKAGDFGKAGTALEGENACSDGVAGVVGADGYPGEPGSAFQLSVEDFDIDF